MSELERILALLHTAVLNCPPYVRIRTYTGITLMCCSGGTVYTAGLNITDIDQIIEIGQVGRAFYGNTTNLFLHRQQGSPWGDTASVGA